MIALSYFERAPQIFGVMRVHASNFRGDDRPPRIRWTVVVALYAAALVARFGYFYLDDLSRHVAGTFSHRLIEEATGVVASFALFPLIVAVERRAPLDRNRWRSGLPFHVAGLIAYSALHTTLMAVLRAIVFPLLGHGSYDYGDMAFRYLMEGGQDVFSYVTIVGLLTLLRVQRRAIDHERRAADLERHATEAQLQSLSLRLQPHFLFNALNTISSTVYHDPVAADEMIGRLGDLLRRSLETTDRQEISLAEEIEVVEAYEALIEARFADRGRFHHEITDDARACAVPAFLLQPLLENAVHHGSMRETSGDAILVRARIDRGSLIIEVENDIPAEPAVARDGVGLGATRERLRLLYGDDAALETSNTKGRFRVIVRLPARKAPPAAVPITTVRDDASAHR